MESKKIQLMLSREGNRGEKINKTPTPAHRLSSPIWNIRDELREASEEEGEAYTACSSWLWRRRKGLLLVPRHLTKTNTHLEACEETLVSLRKISTEVLYIQQRDD